MFDLGTFKQLISMVDSVLNAVNSWVRGNQGP